jgi:hypothetical protein
VKAGCTETFTPKLVGQAKLSPPYTAWTHTFQPLPGRGSALVSDEDTQGNCEDAPKMVRLLDIRTQLVVDSLLAQQQRIKAVAVAVIYGLVCYGLVCGPLLKLPGIPEAGWINLIFIFLGKPASIVRRR